MVPTAQPASISRLYAFSKSRCLLTLVPLMSELALRWRYLTALPKTLYNPGAAVKPNVAVPAMTAITGSLDSLTICKAWRALEPWPFALNSCLSPAVVPYSEATVCAGFFDFVCVEGAGSPLLP